MKAFKISSLVIIGLLSQTSYGQEFEANIQLRPRVEMRNGYKNLLLDGQNPAIFVSQRSRLNLNYSKDKLDVKLSLQNIGTWGDVPTSTPKSKNGIAAYEAWARYKFTPLFQMKVGRQVISYDNQRIFGEIDWAQQGQSHDAAVFTFLPKKHKFDIGLALNADAETLIQTPYTVAAYKAMQFIHYSTEVKSFKINLLAVNVGYEYVKPNLKLRMDQSQTFGTYLVYKKDKWDANLSAYVQTGKKNNQTVTAFDAGANVGYSFTENWNLGLGYEYLSGKSQLDSSNTNKSFQPLFGTNHGFNGFMDYFYVGNHQNSVGLQDAYLKLNYKKGKWVSSLVPHVFYAAETIVNPLGEKMDSYLGTEIDFTLSYAFQSDVLLTGGYSHMLGSKSMERIKGGNVAKTTNWAYVMISFSPSVFSLKKEVKVIE
ncbi:MAG: alginate export family protein [Crocinitomicaceae bacterium]|nr:alginate export family protein [Crocinitomicaceae bacterium]